ncbi:MAG: hypothetical protein PUD81_04070 [Eggerthellales bacterium]|nr:hypothetical protein [Eggerthellales bacterium]
MTAEEQQCSCGCEHEHHHEHHHEECGGCSGCGHHHDQPVSQTLSTSVGGGVLLMRATAHEGAIVVSCTLELEDSAVTPSCLARALQGVAFDVEQAGGIVGHIKCAAVSEKGSARISVTAANIEPTVQAEGLEALNEEADITIAVIVYAVEPPVLLEMLVTRLERVL